MTKEQLKEQTGRNYFKNDFNPFYIIAFTTDDFDKVDVYLTAKTDTGRTYLGEIKSYDDPNYPRPFSKFPNYQIDYAKIDYLVKTAQTQGRIPILYARFSDITLVWDLRTIPYEQRKKWVKTNKKGTDYGEKEYSWQTYLYKNEAVWISDSNRQPS